MPPRSSGDDSGRPQEAAGDRSGPASQQPSKAEVVRAAPPLEIDSDALLGGRSEIRIRHRGEVYRLTLTRAGKLILHK